MFWIIILTIFTVVNVFFAFLTTGYLGMMYIVNSFILLILLCIKLNDYIQKINISKSDVRWEDSNILKDAQGEDLPEINREVIALIQDPDDAWITKVVFAHRPPKYWNGKNIDTGEVTRYVPKTYDKGGWNIPNVVWWLDVKIPNIGEKF